MPYILHSKCRACNSAYLHPVFSLGNQPLANDHCLPSEPRQGFYPLNVLFCRGCGLAQLSVIVNREQLYSRYTYVSSASQTMQRHYDRLFLDICSERPEKSVIEIASNNGGCLKFARSIGFDVLGIDPASNLVEMAQQQGIATLPDFFGVKSAIMAKSTIPEPGVILARHVFAHVANWVEFIAGLEVLATKDTLVVLEFPYILDLFRNGAWDTLYHEHLSIISLNPLVKLLADTPFHIHRVVKVGIHGGALVVMLRHLDNLTQPHLSAEEFISEESITEADWLMFAERSKHKIEQLQKTVRQARSDGKIVSAFGASAKASVLINACGFTRNDIAFVTDNSPLKPGRLIPGTDIPIIDESEMLAEHPDMAIMTAWNFKSEILEKTKRWRERGGTFIIPSPDGVEIV